MVTAKKYVLLEHMHPKSQNVYIRVGKDQRRRKNTLPSYSPHLKVVLTDKLGKTKTIRFKENSDSFDLAQQVKDGIPANEPFTLSERRALEFREGERSTDDLKVQNYLEAYPGFQGFEGKCKDVPRPQYRLHDEQAEVDAADRDFELRLEVGNMIKGLDLEAAQNLIIRLQGSHVKLPDNLAKVRRMLVDHMQTADEKELEKMLNKELSADEEAGILVNKLVGAGLLKFDFKEGQVTRKRGQKFINIKAITAEDAEEMQAKFIEFLTSDAGKDIYSDLEKIK